MDVREDGHSGLAFDRGLVVVELHFRQVAQENAEEKSEVSIGSAGEIEACLPFVEVAGEPQLVGFEAAQGNVVLGRPVEGPERGRRKAAEDLKVVEISYGDIL